MMTHGKLKKREDNSSASPVFFLVGDDGRQKREHIILEVFSTSKMNTVLCCKLVSAVFP